MGKNEFSSLIHASFITLPFLRDLLSDCENYFLIKSPHNGGEEGSDKYHCVSYHGIALLFKGDSSHHHQP